MQQAQPQVIPSALKVPPHNVEAEQAVLGSILINNDALNQIMDVLSEADFYREEHTCFYQGMIHLYNNNEPVDLITLSHHLREKNLLDKTGGLDYLTSLAEAVSTSAGVLYYAQIVRDLSIRRRLIRECSVISDSCFQNIDGTDALLDEAEQSIFDIAEEKAGEGFTHLRDVVKESFKKIESAAEHDGFITGIPTGFADFDRLTTGLQPSDLIIIAARPGMGKTALALNIAHYAASNTTKGVAFFSLEMSKMQLGMRLLGFDAQIDATKLRTGFLRDKDWAGLTQAADNLSELPLYIDDASNLSVMEIRARCRRLKKKTDLCLVIIDYLQLLQGRSSAESRQIEISEISRLLKALAKDLDIPVIALSQLNRKVEDRPNKKPQLADLRESGAIEQDADVIAFIYRDEIYNPQNEESRNIVEIILAKQRNGPTGYFKLYFQKEHTRFRDLKEDEYEQNEF